MRLEAMRTRRLEPDDVGTVTSALASGNEAALQMTGRELTSGPLSPRGGSRAWRNLHAMRVRATRPRRRSDPSECFREFLAKVLHGLVLGRRVVEEREENGHFAGIELNVYPDVADGIADRLRSDLGCRVVPNRVVLEGEEISEVECVVAVDPRPASEREHHCVHSKSVVVAEQLGVDDSGGVTRAFAGREEAKVV